MQQISSQILYTYWNELRGDRIAPRRFDIEPSQLGTILAQTMIIECDAGQAPRFRLAGTKICEDFGRELRGTALADMFSDDDSPAVDRCIHDMCEQGSVHVLETLVSLDRDRSVQFEIMLMPLVHNGDAINRAIGSITPIDPPHWLGTVQLPKLDILRDQRIWPEGRPHAIAEKFRNPPALIPELAGARLVRVNRRSFRVLDGGAR